MKRFAIPTLCAVLALAACATPTTLSPTGQTALQAGVTLATVAANANTTVATAVSKGQLFCKSAAGVVALVNNLSSPTSVIGQTAFYVGQACAAIDGVPVPAPTDVAQGSILAVVAPLPILPTQAAVPST